MTHNIITTKETYFIAYSDDKTIIAVGMCPRAGQNISTGQNNLELFDTEQEQIDYFNDNFEGDIEDYQ